VSVSTVQPDAALQASTRREPMGPAVATTPMAVTWFEARPVHVRKQRAVSGPCPTATLIDPGARGGRAP
jgi:hypothetical protein